MEDIIIKTEDLGKRLKEKYFKNTSILTLEEIIYGIKEDLEDIERLKKELEGDEING